LLADADDTNPSIVGMATVLENPGEEEIKNCNLIKCDYICMILHTLTINNILND